MVNPVVVVAKPFPGRPDLAAKVAAAARLARKVTGLSSLEFGRRACDLYGVKLPDPEVLRANSEIEAAAVVPSSVGLLVLAETCGLPVGVLLGEPSAAEMIARLCARVRVLEELANLPALFARIPA